MGSKTKFGFAAFVAAGLIASAGFTYADAQAQQGDTEISIAPQPEASADPVFISEEVVQPLPEENTSKADETAQVADAATPQASSLRELVAEVDAPATLSRQLECLAGAVYFESRGEPLAGQLAVGRVIVGRSKSGRFPNSYCGVVYQRSQFSFVRGGRMPSIRYGSNAWKKAVAIAQIAHEGSWKSEVDGALFFHARYVNPRWRLTRMAQVGNHVFYR